MSIELNKESVEQADASSCQGTNCGTTTGDHSSECLAEAAAGQGWELKPGDLCGRDCPIHKISVKQAGGDERAAFEVFVRKHCGMPEHIAVNWDAKFTNDAWEGWQARAALAHRAPEVCSECSDTGKVYDESGDGPWSCYACTGNPEVIGYANGDELDNMLDDRTAVLSPGKTSFHTVPVYRLIRAALAQPSQSQYEASFEEWLANELEGEDGQPVPAAVCDITLARRAFNHWPKLEQPAKVGGVRFSAGVSSRLVVEAAQRLYEFESTPEKEAERPEVVARVVHSNPVVLGQCGPLNANDELMTVAQHAASVARWAEMFNRVEQERDAALARVAELERQEPVVRAYGVLPPFAEKVLAKLRRFYDCAEDFESGGVDIGRHWLDLLTQLGLLNRVQRSPALWEISQQGEDLLEAPVAQAQHSVPDVSGCRRNRSALTDAQMRRLYDSSTETENERLGFAAFARLMRRAEAVHQIAAAPGKEVGHE